MPTVLPTLADTPIPRPDPPAPQVAVVGTVSLEIGGVRIVATGPIRVAMSFEVRTGA